MPYTFQVPAVLDMVRAFVRNSLTAQEDPPTALPDAATAAQVVMQAGSFPSTVLKPKTLTVEDMGTSSLLTLPVEIHHIRETEPGTGSGALTCLTRLSQIAADLKNDHKMLSVGGGDIPINNALPTHLLSGEDNPVQVQLEQSDQDVSLTAAALLIEVSWYESALA